MPTQFSFGKIQFDVSLGTAAARTARDAETPFCLAVLGDFSGRSSRRVIEPISQRRLISVDCDNFDSIMAGLSVALRLPAPQRPAEHIDLRFASLEDFHPDQILGRVGPSAKLFAARKRLLDPATASDAAAELQALLKASQPPLPAQNMSTESNDDTLARLLGKSSTAPAPQNAPAAAGIDISGFIKSIVTPSVVPVPQPLQTAMLAALDMDLSAQLRAILHQPAFQDLEAAWRSVDLLVRNFGAEDNLKLFLIDISKEELAGDLKAQEELPLAGVSKLLRHQADHQPLALWLGHYTFGGTLEEIELLGRLAKISALAGAPFIAAASPHLVGCESFGRQPDPDDWRRPIALETSQAWKALRELPEASYLGLALPRFLLRQPYGQDSEPVESFPFQELPENLPHESYLWGNPAMVCGHLLAEAFKEDGWEMRPAGYGELGDLPVHKFKHAGEIQVKPCAEAWLSDRAAERIAAQGLMPLLSIKGRDAVRLMNLQSVAGKPLSIR
jgi:type VI secretion system protein ImpC